MARLPQVINRASANTGTQFFRPVSGDQSVARGLGNLSKAIGGIANQLTADMEKAQREQSRMQGYAAQKSLVEWSANNADVFRDRADNAADFGAGFTESTVNQARENLDKILDEIQDPELRAKTEIAGIRSLTTYAHKAADFELRKRDADIKKLTTAKMKEIEANVTHSVDVQDGLLESYASIEEYVETTGLQGDKADKLRSSMRKVAQSTFVQRYKKENPNAAYSELAGQLHKSKTYTGVQKVIVDQFRIAGLDPTIGLAIAKLESNFNPTAQAKGSSAFGLFQFINGNWSRAKDGTPMKSLDPVVQSRLAAMRFKKFEGRLQANGMKADAANIWGMHFLGPAGFMAFANANPNADAFTVYSRFGRKLATQAFSNNGKLLKRGMTVGQVLEGIRGFVGRRVKLFDGDQPPSSQTIVDDAAPADGDIETAPEGSLKTDGTQLFTVGGLELPDLAAEDLIPLLESARTEAAKQNNEQLDVVEDDAVVNGQVVGLEKHGQKLIDKSDVRTNAAMKLITNPTPENFDAETQRVARQMYMSKAMAAGIEQMLNGTDKATQIEALKLASFYDATRPADGLKESGFSKGTIDLIKTAQALRSKFLVPYDQALAQARKENDPEFNKKFLGDKKQVTNFLNKKINAASVADAFDSKFGASFIPSWSDFTYGLPKEQVLNQLADAARAQAEFYLRDGHGPEAANARAHDDVTRIFGQTSVAGDGKTLSRFPIEMFYPKGPDGSHNYLTDLVREHVQDELTVRLKAEAKRTGNKSLANVEIDIDTIKKEDIHLVPHEDAGRDMVARRAPSYYVFFKDKDGNLQRAESVFRPNVGQKMEIDLDKVRDRLQNQKGETTFGDVFRGIRN